MIRSEGDSTFRECGDSLSKAMQGLLKPCTWCAYVQSQMAHAWFAINRTVVEGDARLPIEKVEHLMMLKSESTAVEPHKERRLRTHSPHTRDMFAAVLFSKEDVLLNVFLHLRTTAAAGMSATVTAAARMSVTATVTAAAVLPRLSVLSVFYRA